ncbi:NAD(+) synthase [Cryomorphaceae bacterium]|nr:NAD(+) synthase [Cryomorphaceae bacterium]
MKTLEVADHITKWIKDYAEQSHCKGFVIGVSGGIDSATSSTLAARTGLPLICVEMPIHQAANQVSRAMNHIAWLKEHFPNVSSVEVELTDIFDSFVGALPPVTGSKDLHDHSLVNTRARFRMTTLYYFAALHGYLVVGTGNKVEDFGIGFYTKYGDGGVDLSPIADLMKTDVYAIAEALGVNQEILDAPPTDGLWGDDRTDEDQIGASYPELEWAMDYSGDESDLNERQKEVLSIYRRLNRANQHKMEPIPVCVIPEDLR